MDLIHFEQVLHRLIRDIEVAVHAFHLLNLSLDVSVSLHGLHLPLLVIVGEETVFNVLVDVGSFSAEQDCHVGHLQL